MALTPPGKSASNSSVPPPPPSSSPSNGHPESPIPPLPPPLPPINKGPPGAGGSSTSAGPPGSGGGPPGLSWSAPPPGVLQHQHTPLQMMPGVPPPIALAGAGVMPPPHPVIGGVMPPPQPVVWNNSYYPTYDPYFYPGNFYPPTTSSEPGKGSITADPYSKGTPDPYGKGVVDPYKPDPYSKGASEPYSGNSQADKPYSSNPYPSKADPYSGKGPSDPYANASKGPSDPYANASKGRTDPHANASKGPTDSYANASKGPADPYGNGSKVAVDPYGNGSKGAIDPYGNGSKGAVDPYGNASKGADPYAGKDPYYESYKANKGAPAESYNGSKGAPAESYNGNKGATPESYNGNKGAIAESYNGSAGATTTKGKKKGPPSRRVSELSNPTDDQPPPGLEVEGGRFSSQQGGEGGGGGKDTMGGGGGKDSIMGGGYRDMSIGGKGGKDKDGKRFAIGLDGKRRNVIKGDAFNSMRNKGAEGFDAAGNYIGKDGNGSMTGMGSKDGSGSMMGGRDGGSTTLMNKDVMKGKKGKMKQARDPDREEAKKMDAKAVAAMLANADISTDNFPGVESSAQLEAQLEAHKPQAGMDDFKIHMDGISAMLNNPDLPAVGYTTSTESRGGEPTTTTYNSIRNGGGGDSMRNVTSSGELGGSGELGVANGGEIDLEYIENENDKRYLQNLEYGLTGPMDADNLDRYPRIENWLLGQKQLGVSFKCTADREGLQAPLIAMLQFASMGNVGEKPKVLLLRTHANSESGVMLPESVLQVLTDKHVIKSVVGGAGDQSRIQRSFGIGMAGVKDPSEIAKDYETVGKLQNGGHVQMGLRDLCDKFGFPFIRDRRIANSNWEKPNLSPAQIRTAADDAWFSLRCYLRLEEERRTRHTQVKRDELQRWNERKGGGKR